MDRFLDSADPGKKARSKARALLQGGIGTCGKDLRGDTR